MPSAFWARTRVRKRGGQPRWEVRAFLPQAETAEVACGGQRCPMEKQHAQGFFCAVARRRASALPHTRAAVGRPRGRNGRPLPLRAADFRYRSVSAQRGHAARGLQHAGRAPGGGRGRGRRALRGVGAQRRSRGGDRRVQRLGHPPPSHAPAQRRRVGDLHSRRWAKARPTSTTSGRASPATSRSRPTPTRSTARRRPKSASVVWDLGKYQWNDAAWMEARAKTDWLKSPVSVYEVHLESWLRGPHGAAADLPRAGRQAGGVRAARWATRTSSCCPSWSIRSPAPGATR